MSDSLIAHNQLIQKMFQMIGAGEKAGSGIPKITRAWAEQHWHAPSITENLELNETRLRLTLVGLCPQDVLDSLQTRYGRAFADLADRERAILISVVVQQEAEHGDLLAVVGGHSRDLTLGLQGLLKKGMLNQDRPGRGCRYSIVGGEVSARQNAASPHVTPHVTPHVQCLLEVCSGEMLREELQERIGLADRKHFRTDYLQPALSAGLIEMTILDKPRSSKQRYRLTAQGRLLAESQHQGQGPRRL